MPDTFDPETLTAPGSLMSWLRSLFQSHGLASEQWAPEPEPEPIDTIVELDEATARDDVDEGDEPIQFVDHREAAGRERYKAGRFSWSGKVKATLFRRRPERICKTIVVHAMGVNRPRSSTRWDKVSAHYVIAPDGDILWLFDHQIRLLSANSFDRWPHYAINIEVAGNFEGEDGAGNWYKPEKFGRGRATDRQLRALAVCIEHIEESVRKAGGQIELVAPHRLSGRNRDGRPNRPLCPGSRVWQAAEACAIRLGLRVPRPREKYGGTVVPESWRSDAWKELHHGAGGG